MKFLSVERLKMTAQQNEGPREEKINYSIK
jgi:hypothetical protein